MSVVKGRVLSDPSVALWPHTGGGGGEVEGEEGMTYKYYKGQNSPKAFAHIYQLQTAHTWDRRLCVSWHVLSVCLLLWRLAFSLFRTLCCLEDPPCSRTLGVASSVT